ncbi:hypothetical protein ABIA72_002066 [Stenotrophomonas rhizophila]
MRALPDKWNFRLWLREWLNQPSQAAVAERKAAEAAAREFFMDLERTAAATPTCSLKVVEGVVVGLTAGFRDSASAEPRKPAR